MTQLVFPDIDPNVTSGTQLATLLNDFKYSLLDQHTGNAQPSYIQTGTVWIDDTNTPILSVKLYDGTQDITLYTVDITGHVISYGGNNATSSFRAERTDTAADMIEMFRNTASITNGGLIFSQINDNATKKTMGALRLTSESVADTAEEGSFSVDVMVAGTLTEIAKFESGSTKIVQLAGTGDATVGVDANGNLSRTTGSSGSGVDNLFANGNAINADIGTYVQTGLTAAISSAAADLIDSTKVFQVVAGAISQTLETETITLKNGNLESPLIVGLKYKCATDWTIEIIDNTLATIKTVTLPAYVPTANESDLHKAFIMIPAGTVSVTVKFTSTAADTLLYDALQVYSWSASDEALQFRETILNNQTNTKLFTLINRKNSMYKIEGQLTRLDDSTYADGLFTGYISYDSNGVVWRLGNETLFEHESDALDISFNINGNDIEYTTSNYVDTNYAGTFKGRITRVL